MNRPATVTVDFCVNHATRAVSPTAMAATGVTSVLETSGKAAGPVCTGAFSPVTASVPATWIDTGVPVVAPKNGFGQYGTTRIFTTDNCSTDPGRETWSPPV